MNYFEIGVNSYKERKYDIAIQMFKKIQLNDINYFISQYNIGVCYIKKAETEKSSEEHFKTALFYFYKALKIQKTYDIVFNIAYIYLNLNEIKKSYIYTNIASTININHDPQCKALLDILTNKINKKIIESC